MDSGANSLHGTQYDRPGSGAAFAALTGSAVALVAGLASAAAVVAPVAEPINPTLTDSGVVIADDGISFYDSRTRALRWQSLQQLQTDAPTLAGDKLFVGTSRGLYVLELASGRTLWKLPSKARLFSPLVVGDSVFVSGEDGSLRSLDARSGELHWKRRFSGWLYPPAVAGNLLLITGQGHRLLALSAADGTLVWERPLPHEPVFRPVPLAGGLVIVTTFAADILALHSQSGSLSWSVRDSIAHFSPQARGDRLYFRTIDGGLKVRQQGDGALLWTAALEGHSQHPLVFRGGHVLALDGGSRLRVYDIETGTPVVNAPSVMDGGDLLGSFGGHTVILRANDTVASPGSQPTARYSAAVSTEERKQWTRKLSW